VIRSRRAGVETWEFISGVRDTVPPLLGALPFGLIYGALAATSDLSTMAALAMSAMYLIWQCWCGLGLILGNRRTKSGWFWG
jgi:predicted branched-subunit amino acid permease